MAVAAAAAVTAVVAANSVQVVAVQVLERVGGAEAMDWEVVGGLGLGSEAEDLVAVATGVEREDSVGAATGLAA